MLNTALVIILALLAGVSIFGSIFYTNKYLNEVANKDMEKSMMAVHTALHLVLSIVAMALVGTKFNGITLIIVSTMMFAIIIMQLMNMQGRERFCAWNCLAALYAVIYAYYNAAQFDGIYHLKGFSIFKMVGPALLFIISFICGKIKVSRLEKGKVKANGKVWKIVGWILIVLLLISAIASIVQFFLHPAIN